MAKYIQQYQRGLGIAYPEIKPDPFGFIETRVDRWKFMTYLNKVMPVWFKYHTRQAILRTHARHGNN